jgi:hypothetical protein
MAAVLERDPDIEPMFISNDSASDLVRAGLMPRGATFLRKPFQEAAFLALVAALLSPRPVQPQEHLSTT